MPCSLKRSIEYAHLSTVSAGGQHPYYDHVFERGLGCAQRESRGGRSRDFSSKAHRRVYWPGSALYLYCLLLDSS